MAPLVSTGAACGLSAPSSRCMPSSAVIMRGSRATETAAGWMQWGWKVAGDSPAMAEVALGSPSPALSGSQALPCGLLQEQRPPSVSASSLRARGSLHKGGTHGRNVPSAHSVWRCISLLEVTQMQANAYKHHMWEERVLYLFVTALINFQEV